MADMFATPAELASALQVASVDTASATLVLELATAKVQDAAGQRIIDTTSTFVIDVGMDDCDQCLALPQRPVRSVASVLIDGVADTAWYLRSQMLWRLVGWNTNASAPTQVTAVGVAHGYLAGAQGLQLAKGFVLDLATLGYGNPSAATSEAIDDYRVTFAAADARMQVTASMRDRLQAAYGIPAHVTVSRS